MWLLCLIILMPPSVPLYSLVCWKPRYRAVRSRLCFHVSAHTNYISVIIWQSHEGMLAQERQLTEWYGHQTTSCICKLAFTTSTEFNTSFQELCPAPCSSFYSAPTVLYFIVTFASLLILALAQLDNRSYNWCEPKIFGVFCCCAYSMLREHIKTHTSP